MSRVPFATRIFRAKPFEGAGGHRCSIPVVEQLASFRCLPDGWCDGEGSKLELSTLNWSATLLRGVTKSFEVPTPHLYPTPEGRVRAEWSTANWEISAELDPTHETVEVHAVSFDTDEARARAFRLRDPGQEAQLGRWLALHTRPE